MSKQKLAELVMQKMLEKKQEEQKNRPHREVLQLLVKFQVENYRSLTKQIQDLEESIRKENTIMEQLNDCCLELENTGKKNYPRIIINPDFIASQHVKASVKEYYRKAANTFLREDIIKRRQFEIDCRKMQRIKQLFQCVNKKQSQILAVSEKDRTTKNNKRVRNLKEDLRLRFIREEQKNIEQEINDEKQLHKSLIDEYELKKTNLQSRVDWAQKLDELIEQQKRLIQKVYNPIAYRDYLKTVFGIRTKNQYMQKNLSEVVKRVGEMEFQTNNKERFLEKKYKFYVQGKCAEQSPKKKKSQAKQFSSASPSKKRANSQMKVSRQPQRINTQKMETPKQSSRKENISFGSFGKTTASSMSNLLKDSSIKKRAFSGSVELGGHHHKNKISAI